MVSNISVGFYGTDKGQDNRVGLTVNKEVLGLSPELARHLAVDLMLWADRIDPPETKEKLSNEN